MGAYTNVTTSPTTTTLIAKSSTKKGSIKKITIANFSDHADGATVNVWWNLDGTATDYYIIKNVVIPKGATLVLEDNLAFDRSKYVLKMLNTGTSPALTVIIK